MKGQILDYTMFDDGSIDCKNFYIATQVDGLSCEWNYIFNRYSGRICRLIIEAAARGEHYISLNPKNPLERIMIENDPVLEIQWD